MTLSPAGEATGLGRPMRQPGGFKTVSAGDSHNCGIRTDDTVVCWGANESGQATEPKGDFKTVSAGGGSCAIRSDDTVVCWGGNWAGQTDARRVVSKLSAQATAIVAGYVAMTLSSAGEATGLGRPMRRRVVSKLSAQASAIVAGYAAMTLSSAGEPTSLGRPPSRQVV